jgi:PST family polysaccharide transporter
VSLSKTVAKSLVWTSLESFALSGLSLISLFVFARLLTPRDFGVTAVALAIVQLLNTPVELLFHDALIQRQDLRPAHVNSAFTVSVLLGAALCAICWLVSPLVEASVHEPGLSSVLRYMSLSLPAMGFASVVMAMQRRNMHFRSLALRSLIGRAGSAVIALALAFMGAGLWSLVVQQVLLVGLGTLMLWVLATADERPRFQLEWSAVRDLLGFGVASTAMQLAAMLMPRVFMVMVGGFLGSENAGRLSIAFRGLDMLRDLLTGAVSQIAMPVFSRLSSDRAAVSQAYNRGTELTTLVTFPIFVGLAVCAPEVVSLAFGPQWELAVPYFAVVALLTLPFFGRLYATAMLKALGHPVAPIGQFLIETAYVALGMLAFGRHSLVLAMAVWVSRHGVGLPIDFWLMLNYGGMKVREQLRGIGVPSLACAIMACVVLAVAQALPGLPLPALRLIPKVVAGAITYVGVLWLMDRQQLSRLTVLVGQSLQARRG